MLNDINHPICKFFTLFFIKQLYKKIEVDILQTIRTTQEQIIEAEITSSMIYFQNEQCNLDVT